MPISENHQNLYTEGDNAYSVVLRLISLFCGVSEKKVKDTEARSSTATIMSSNIGISSP